MAMSVISYIWAGQSIKYQLPGRQRGEGEVGPRPRAGSATSPIVGYKGIESQCAQEIGTVTQSEIDSSGGGFCSCGLVVERISGTNKSPERINFEPEV